MKTDLTVPSSKSHTLRAILFAALADGTSQIERFLVSPDTTAMIKAVFSFGATVHIQNDTLKIRGVAGKLQPPHAIECGNSGIVLRFIGALAALLPYPTILTGDASIQQRRLATPLLEALRQLGASATSIRGDGFAPLCIQGPITQKSATLDGEDSQPVSGLLIAARLAPHPIELHVTNPGEKPWVDLTLHWLRRLGIRYERRGASYYRLEGNAKIDAFSYCVPGDFSSAAFPIAAALITNAELTLHNLDLEDCQGDQAILPALEQMGATFEWKGTNLIVRKGAHLRGISLDINDFIDALPILAVIGCFAKGRTKLYNAAIARKKESDRIHAMATELKKMGARIEEMPDGLIIHSSVLHEAPLQSYNDHRVAMALAVAALGAKSFCAIADTGCVAKTYPNFWEDLEYHSLRI